MQVDAEFLGHLFSHCFSIIKGKKHFEKIDDNNETNRRKLIAVVFSRSCE